MTYQSCGQVGSIDVLDLMEIGPMVLASYLQMLEPRSYDNAKYLVDNIHTYLLNFKNINTSIFRHYSLLIHMILYYGQMRDMCNKNLKLNIKKTNVEDKPV